MSLRTSVLLGVALAWSLWCGVQYELSRRLLETSTAEHETSDGIATMRRVQLYLMFATDRLQRSSRDWSDWDETYRFLRGDNPLFPTDNIDPSVFQNLAIDVIAYLHTDGTLAFGQHVEFGNLEERPFPPDLIEAVITVGHHRPGPHVPYHDVVALEQGLFAFAAREVTNSAKDGEVAGVQIFGFFLDDFVVGELTRSLGIDVQIYPLTGAILPSDAVKALASLSTNSPPLVLAQSAAQLVTYGLLKNGAGKAIGLIKCLTPRTVVREAARKQRQLMIVSIGFGLIVGLLVLWFLEARVMGRLKALSSGLALISAIDGGRSRLPDSANGDEIGQLTKDLNSMLAQLETRHDIQRAHDTAVAAANQKSTFLANMSHEIRTPMNGLLGMLQLVLESPFNEAQRERVQAAYRSGTSLLTLLNDILDFSKIEAGKLDFEDRDFVPLDTMEEAAMLFAPNCEQKGVQLSCFIDPALAASFRGDPHRIKQVLTNLIGNAVKFTSAGEVRIRAVLEAERKLIRVDVADTGIGIPPERVDLLFQPFTQADASMSRRYGGTGLGLAICHRLAEGMGGELSVESTPGAGTCFTFRWPLQASTGQPTQLALPGYAGRRALIAGLAGGSLDSLTAYLRALGFETEIIADLDVPGVAGDLIFVGDAANGVARPVDTQTRQRKVPSIHLTSFYGSQRLQAHDHARPIALSTPVRFRKLCEAIALALNPGVLPASMRRAEGKPVASLGSTAGKRVLLVEDNVINQTLALAMLESYDVLVDCADTGLAALASLEATRYDLVLMDCQMPTMDGFEATRRWREREAIAGLPRVPIVALTANAMVGDRDRCLAAGMDDYLAKPFTRDALTEILRQWLADKTLPRGTVTSRAVDTA